LIFWPIFPVGKLLETDDEVEYSAASVRCPVLILIPIRIHLSFLFFF